MPIYEYKCTKCNKEFECLVLKSDDAICCPDCNDDCVERLMSACSFKSSGNFSSKTAALVGEKFEPSDKYGRWGEKQLLC
jgi:putative FmdB family regulatory protein